MNAPVGNYAAAFYLCVGIKFNLPKEGRFFWAGWNAFTELPAYPGDSLSIKARFITLVGIMRNSGYYFYR